MLLSYDGVIEIYKICLCYSTVKIVIYAVRRKDFAYKLIM